MDAKIQELTEKIYNEGVKQGQAEADRLIAEAETRATKIEADATARAEEIIKSAVASCHQRSAVGFLSVIYGLYCRHRRRASLHPYELPVVVKVICKILAAFEGSILECALTIDIRREYYSKY